MAKIRRRRALEAVPEVTCPAALPVAGAVPSRAGVICRIMQREAEGDDGIGSTPGQLQTTRDAEGGTFLTVRSDPSTIERFCCGTAIPVVDHLSVKGGRSSCTYCPVWQAEKQRIAEGRDMLAGGGLEDEPELVQSPGYDPERNAWAQSREALDELAS